ncbi:hypothetical protein Lgee_1884 [Legionella geestiana]|uniref:Uncharacterized protein n=1 Tax=Legionella geestiana TaxID=45065 RepID=A0A0W0TNP1_9GAMM|nr:hypothetical protein [Legionella geestiana]KTC97223.1 hypothetical protein Lgee_1884 [Legionella geestiana]QBS12356.1 hypothetical protein E4T54_06140 [Legionella geestiana]QDQ39931.1 hypothetical protein E3226_005720 [Legionella geestiana]STX55206.1 Uncharacterised protein [Legionella geestiana]
MWIQLNILGDGSSARIYARAKPREAGYQTGFDEWRGVYIWHTDEDPAMQKLRKHQVNNRENDLFVNFKSRVPFADFCKKFAQSSFNDPGRYQLFWHNCTHSALFALRLAEIPLKMPLFLGGKLARQSWLPVPFLLTPMALYRVAEAYKIRCIEVLPPRRHPLARAERAFRKRQNFFPEARQEVLKPVLEATQNCLKRYPQQPEFYLKALERSLDVAACPKKLPHYRLFADRYRFRDASWRDTEVYLLIHVTELYFLTMMTLTVAGMMSMSLIFILTLSAGSFMALRLGVDAPSDKQKRPLLPAPLSKAMVRLADTLEQEEDAPLQTENTLQ